MRLRAGKNMDLVIQDRITVTNSPMEKRGAKIQEINTEFEDKIVKRSKPSPSMRQEILK